MSASSSDQPVPSPSRPSTGAASWWFLLIMAIPFPWIPPVLGIVGSIVLRMRDSASPLARRNGVHAMVFALLMLLAQLAATIVAGVAGWLLFPQESPLRLHELPSGVVPVFMVIVILLSVYAGVHAVVGGRRASSGDVYSPWPFAWLYRRYVDQEP